MSWNNKSKINIMPIDLKLSENDYRNPSPINQGQLQTKYMHFTIFTRVQIMPETVTTNKAYAPLSSNQHLSRYNYFTIQTSLLVSWHDSYLCYPVKLILLRCIVPHWIQIISWDIIVKGKLPNHPITMLTFFLCSCALGRNSGLTAQSINSHLISNSGVPAGSIFPF